jgi:hypothetical protein
MWTKEKRPLYSMTFHPTYREILIKKDIGCKLRILIKQKMLELNPALDKTGSSSKFQNSHVNVK